MKLIYSLALLSGTIIGVGLFALPYATLKVGFWIILGYFFVLGPIVILVHLFFGELAIKTPNHKRFPGFAKTYLGRRGEIIAYLTTILGLFGAILSYLIIGGEFLSELFSSFFGGNSVVYTVIYFIFGALLIFYGVKIIAKIEFWGLLLFFIILFFIFLRGRSFLVIDNLFPAPDLSQIFLPYGVILFSLWGASLIPEAEEILKEKNKMLLRIIPIAILIPIIVYLFFIFLILGITGPQTTESALSGLRNLFGDGIVTAILCFGLLTTFTSFIALGLTLKKVFWYDLKISKNLAWAITCFAPLILFLAGVKNFIPLISFVGAVFLGLDGILILLMYKKIRPERKFLIYPLILVFIGGIIYELIYFIK